MKRISILVLALILVTTAASAGGVRHGSLDSTTASLDRVIEIDRSDATFLLGLSILAVTHRIPIGFELSINAEDNINRQIHLKSGTLKSILDSLVAQEPRYKWELRDGVINITPKVGRDPFLAHFLDTRVGRFVPPPGTTDKFKLRDAVLNLPEVLQLLETSAVSVRPYDYPYRGSIYSTDDVNLEISDTNVRGVLNHMAKQTEHKMWSLERVGEKKE